MNAGQALALLTQALAVRDELIQEKVQEMRELTDAGHSSEEIKRALALDSLSDPDFEGAFDALAEVLAPRIAQLLNKAGGA